MAREAKRKNGEGFKGNVNARFCSEFCFFNRQTSLHFNLLGPYLELVHTAHCLRSVDINSMCNISAFNSNFPVSNSRAGVHVDQSRCSSVSRDFTVFLQTFASSLLTSPESLDAEFTVMARVHRSAFTRSRVTELSGLTLQTPHRSPHANRLETKVHASIS